MTKSKTFWVCAALSSCCAAIFCGYIIYNRLVLHFSKDTLDITTQAETEAKASPPPVLEQKEQQPKEEPQTAAKSEEKTEQPAAKEDPQKVKAVKTHFEYKNASARSVSVSGSFTSWKEVKMAKKNGVWKAEVYILPGSYIYHFTVDNKKTLDPGKPKAAVGESIVEVK